MTNRWSAGRAQLGIAALAAACTFAAPLEAAAVRSDVAGAWQPIDERTGQPNGAVRITIEGDRLVGRIERLRPGVSPESTCTKCPDPQKGKRLLGLTVLWGLAPDGDGWSGGNVLDPDSGDVYRARAKLVDRDTLEVRGYVGVPMLGRSQRWRRLP